jgi:hypothetical protein
MFNAQETVANEGHPGGLYGVLLKGKPAEGGMCRAGSNAPKEDSAISLMLTPGSAPELGSRSVADSRAAPRI